jgi:ribosomal protein S18 acetylase RimI-like enzyme
MERRPEDEHEAKRQRSDADEQQDAEGDSEAKPQQAFSAASENPAKPESTEAKRATETSEARMEIVEVDALGASRWAGEIIEMINLQGRRAMTLDEYVKKSRGGHFLIYIVNDKIVGMLRYTRFNYKTNNMGIQWDTLRVDESKEYLRISGFYTRLENRRQGIASKLLQNLIDQQTKQHGEALLCLDVDSNNANAIALYEKFEFRQVGSLRFGGKKNLEMVRK